MRTIILVMFLAFSFTAMAQEYSTSSKKAIRQFEKGRELFQNKNDEAAEVYLLNAVKLDGDFIEALFMLAQISFDRGDLRSAAAYYLKGVNADPDGYTNGYLKVAEIEFNIGDYQSAQEHLDTWNSYNIRNRQAQDKAGSLARNLEFALHAISHPVAFNPVSLGSNINTEQFEYWPSLSIDEKTIFFTVLGPPNPDLPPARVSMQEDFYFSRLKDGKWTQRQYLGPPVNTNRNEGAQSVTADGKFIYFTACNHTDGYGQCDIFFSKVKVDGTWSKPENLGPEINTNGSEKHPAISADGRILYFASNRPGSRGSYDIWMSEKKGKRWTSPVNLGDSINTEGMEQSPFIHPDQQTLYFSSDGWPGMGRGDIFLSRRDAEGKWGLPQNLGYPINTYNEEVAFVVNAAADRAYFSSNRREETDTDIFTFELPKELRPAPVSYISGRVYDSRNYKGIEAVFQLIDLETGELAIEAVSNPGEGDYLVSIPSGKKYAFNVSQPGYLFYSDHFELRESLTQAEAMKKDIPLDPIREGKLIVLNNIFFETDSFNLAPTSRIELEKIYEFLLLNKKVRVEISGHTDNTGRSEYNRKLSEKRALAVVRYLVAKGLDDSRLSARGYGDTAPVSDNDTEEGRALNRRTELKVIGVE